MKTPPLQKLYCYLTEGCNMACSHCWLSPKFDESGTKHPVLPVALFEQALAEAKPLGLASVKLTGGEPLLHPAFGEILDIVLREQLHLDIETNGILMTPELAEKIGRFPSADISVSLDGADAATHESVRGVAGSFDKACEAVRLLAAVGTPPQIIMTIMRANAGQAGEMVTLAERLGASSLKFNVLQPSGRGAAMHRNDRALGAEEVLELGRRVEEELQAEAPLPLLYDHPPAFRSLRRLAFEGESGICGILTILGVIATGRYALCGIGNSVGNLVFGRVGMDPLAKVWEETPLLRELRAGLPERLEGVCARCLMKHRCLGVCVAQSYQRSSTFWAPHWICEAAEERGLFPASRIRNLSKTVVSNVC